MILQNGSFLGDVHNFLFKLLTPNAENILLQRELLQRQQKEAKAKEKELDSMVDVEIMRLLNAQQQGQQLLPQQQQLFQQAANVFADAGTQPQVATQALAPQAAVTQQQRTQEEELRRRQAEKRKVFSGIGRRIGLRGVDLEDWIEINTGPFESEPLRAATIQARFPNFGASEADILAQELQRARLEQLRLANAAQREEAELRRQDREFMDSMRAPAAALSPTYAGPRGLERLLQEQKRLLDAQIGAAEGAGPEKIASQFNMRPAEARAVFSPLPEDTYRLVVENLQRGIPVQDIIDGNREAIRRVAEQRLRAQDKKKVTAAELEREVATVEAGIRQIFLREFIRTQGFSVPLPPDVVLPMTPTAVEERPAVSRDPVTMQSEISEILRGIRSLVEGFSRHAIPATRRR